ncbi:hypothetical protein GE061_019038 [Apolygus lucorum]|uniref:Uncharacterized protein n=1 Tax=Apolygus lucorum TaxID=248454 RepID=A0A6A4JR36_APOLU|nr:hypothetical protein GE061_019038 [Apolygus lucorum]
MASTGLALKLCAAGAVFALASGSFWNWNEVQMTQDDINYVIYKQNVWPDPKMPKVAQFLNGTREDKKNSDGSVLTKYTYWYIEPLRTTCQSKLSYLLPKGSKLVLNLARMREISWSLVLGFILAAMALPALASRLYFDDESYMTGERGGRDETDNQMYEEVNKRALVALSRFKTFASALSPDIHRYAPRSYFPGIDSNLALGAIDRRGRPAQNPMRFGR